MGDDFCLLNLDTGDYIKLGKPFLENEAVPEVGYEGPHLLISGLPNIPYGVGGAKQEKPAFLDIMSRNGHALSAFLAVSFGCRLIVVSSMYIIENGEVGPYEGQESNTTGVHMLSFGQLGNTYTSGDIRDEKGEEISEGTQFYRARLKKTIDGEKYEPIDEADRERLRVKKEYYTKEIQRALGKNVTRRRTETGQLARNSDEDPWVYLTGQKPAEPTLDD